MVSLAIEISKHNPLQLRTQLGIGLESAMDDLLIGVGVMFHQNPDGDILDIQADIIGPSKLKQF